MVERDELEAKGNCKGANACINTTTDTEEHEKLKKENETLKLKLVEMQKANQVFLASFQSLSQDRQGMYR